MTKRNIVRLESIIARIEALQRDVDSVTVKSILGDAKSRLLDALRLSVIS